MPSPISNNSSVYDPSSLMSEAGSCDPSVASSSPPAVQPAAITIPDVHIEGDAGAQELMRRLDCRAERNAALHSCASAAIAGLAGVASSGTVIGAIAGGAAAFNAGIACGRDLRAYVECTEQ